MPIDKDQLKQALDKNGVDPACPSCKEARPDWDTAPNPIDLHGKNRAGEDVTYPTILQVCPNCSYYQMFSAQRLGFA